jgi:hypothetical protein
MLNKVRIFAHIPPFPPGRMGIHAYSSFLTTPSTAYMAGAIATTAVQTCQLRLKVVVEHVRSTAVGLENVAELKFRQNLELGPCVDSFRPQVSRLWLAIAVICSCGKPSPPTLESETLARLAGRICKPTSCQ